MAQHAEKGNPETARPEKPWPKTAAQIMLERAVHDVEFAPSIDVVISETLPALESLRQAGIIRYIGVTGYPLHTLKAVIERSAVRLDTVLSYCRGTLFDDSLADYMPFFQEMGLGVANAAPLGMGLLTSSPPPVWHPAAEELKKACAEAAIFCQCNQKLAVFLKERGCKDLDSLAESADDYLEAQGLTDLARGVEDTAYSKSGTPAKEPSNAQEKPHCFIRLPVDAPLRHKPSDCRSMSTGSKSATGWNGKKPDSFPKDMNGRNEALCSLSEPGDSGNIGSSLPPPRNVKPPLHITCSVMVECQLICVSHTSLTPRFGVH
ncbi:hypothetical protein MTO96_026568 [Rhipicephalus appendiculatus]